MTTQPAPPEFSRPLIVGHIPAKGVEQTIEAKPAERVALATRFELIAIDSLTATLTAEPGRLGSVTVTGNVQAAITQRCVVTLDPLPATLDIPVDTVFLPVAVHQDGAGPAEGADMEEDVEFYTHGRIDLGELAAQQMAMAMDPYPRKPGAELTLPDRPIDREAMVESHRPALAGLALLAELAAKTPSKPPRKG